ncbi:DUF302 domain-containing protein [Elusimicrobiota bacterium]
MIYAIETEKSVREVERSFPEAAKKHGFGVLGTHDLKSKMNEKGVDFDRECLVFEVCNPNKAKKVLEGDMAISTALPCRVSVYDDGGKTKIATIKPTALLGMFPNPELKPVAEEVERILFDIMKDAA